MGLVAAIYVLALLLLCFGFYYAHPLRSLKAAGQAAGTALATMRDGSIDDIDKEKTVQRCAVEMVRQAVALAVKLVVVAAVAALPVWQATALGWMDIEAFWEFVLRTDVILVSTAAILLPLLAVRHFNRTRQ
jgi:hypothetical protein